MDPIFGVLIGLFILPRTWKLLTQAVNVLLEATPTHIKITAVEQAMLEVSGVQGVHDLHIWTITSGMEALSAHVVLADGSESQTSSRVLETITAKLKEEFGIDHTTIQVEHLSRREKETQH